MYGYTHDSDTGGLLLNNSMPIFSKEPRPVYSQEMDILGFDKHWVYEKQDRTPYMWAEANCYWYRGQMVVKTKGGSLYSKPEIEFVHKDDIRVLSDGEVLKPVDIDAMVEKNKELMEVIERTTLRKIYSAYRRYKSKVDCFHVAFSGGKDSVVLLYLVKKALPQKSFFVVFGDTGMEFPDTYDVIEDIEKQCKEDGIEFYRAESHLKPEESWRLFGPPSRVLRWCCYVHKTAPQTLLLRKVLSKSDYKGMAFVGVRLHESDSREEHLTKKDVNEQSLDQMIYINLHEKTRGQRTAKSIFEWSSAEVWMYIYSQNLIINESYKKGNSRAGCTFCPSGGGKADFFRNICYPNEIRKYTEIISDMIDDKYITSIESYLTNGGWEARMSGRDLKNNVSRYNDITEDKFTVISISNPKSEWKEWIKTINLNINNIDIESSNNSITARISSHVKDLSTVKLIKQVFYKSAYCIGCRVCEANCPNDSISFKNRFEINNCAQCGDCHKIPYGCYIADSLKMPIYGGKKMSLNTLEEHAPKPEWIKDFFEKQDEFFQDNSLGRNQLQIFKRFLSDSSLASKSKVTYFAQRLTKIGWETEQVWGLILIELAYNNPQIKWYIVNLRINVDYKREQVESELLSIGQSEKMARAIVSAFKRLSATPLGTIINFGSVSETGTGRKKEMVLYRNKSSLSDIRVILYSLYKFAEACEGYYQFTLSRLYDYSADSAGISPTMIFGFERDEMTVFLNAMSVKYPEFIHFTSIHDLEKISLREDKTSSDVLELFN